MVRSAGWLGCAFVGIAMASAVAAEGQGASMSVGEATLTPLGWAEFCQRYEGQCDGEALSSRDIEATLANIGFIGLINRMVNKRVAPRSDVEHWNVVDRWDLAEDGFGDCEDYALLKRKILIEAGFPRQALLLTIVRDEQDEGHAVLTASTTRGDFILDNMSNDLKLWSRTPYRYVKRQSQQDQNVWVGIEAPVPSARIARR